MWTGVTPTTRLQRDLFSAIARVLLRNSAVKQHIQKPRVKQATSDFSGLLVTALLLNANLEALLN